MQKNKSKKIIVIILALIATLVIGFIVLVSCSTFLLLNNDLGLKKTPLTGEIKVLESEPTVNKPIGLLLEVPKDLEDLHMEMWDVTYIGDDGNEERLLDDIIESEQISQIYTADQIEEMFGTSDISKYHNKIAVFIPSRRGKYKIDVYGYFNTTSPREVTYKEIVVK